MKKAQFKYSASITSLCSSKSELRFPVVVIIAQYADDDFVASWPEIDVYGSGKSEDQALLSLKQTIVNIHEGFANTPDKDLGKIALFQKQILKRAIEEKKGKIVDIYVTVNESNKYDVYAFVVGYNGYESIPGYDLTTTKDSEKDALLCACDWAEVLFCNSKITISKIYIQGKKSTYFTFSSAEEAEKQAKNFQKESD